MTRFEEVSFIAQPDISIDYAVMEKAERIVMVQPVSVGRMWAHGMRWLAPMRLTKTVIALLASMSCILSVRPIHILRA